MQVWAATVDANSIDNLEDIYQQALNLLDWEARERVERFYHRIDSFRGLVGALLIRMLLHERGIPLRSMRFSATAERKPYITCDGLAEPIGYNITHDNGVIAMAFASGADLHPDPPAYKIGTDVMLLQLPKRTTYTGFVETVSDQLTEYEQRILLPSPPLETQEALRRFYLIWTLKEAYTKALGLGLGFDFRRIEYDVPNDVVRIDGKPPAGWEFVRFEIKRGNVETYVGVVARYMGVREDDKRRDGIVESRAPGDWLKVYDAGEFVQRALRELQ